MKRKNDEEKGKQDTDGIIEYKKDGSVRMSIKCFLCGNEGANISPYWDNRLTRLVKCPNCGDYRITEQAAISITNGKN
jgi:DNA-directed RNA polymerase subunit RPC12/RpoP